MTAPQIKTLKIQDQKIRALLYGNPGAGKTTFAATAAFHPDMRDVLVLSIDRGEASIASLGKFSVVEINTTKDLEAVLWALVNNAEGYQNVKTIIADGVSELLTLELENIVSQDLKRAGNLDDVQLQDHGIAGRRIARIVRYFRDCGRHLIMTAWAKEVFAKQGVDTRKITKEEMTPISIIPALGGKLGSEIQGYMDFVWYLKAGPDGKRYALVQPDGLHAAKTRGLEFAKALGQFIEIQNPSDRIGPGYTMASLYDLRTSIEQHKETDNV